MKKIFGLLIFFVLVTGCSRDFGFWKDVSKITDFTEIDRSENATMQIDKDFYLYKLYSEEHISLIEVKTDQEEIIWTSPIGVGAIRAVNNLENLIQVGIIDINDLFILYDINKEDGRIIISKLLPEIKIYKVLFFDNENNSIYLSAKDEQTYKLMKLDMELNVIKILNNQPMPIESMFSNFSGLRVINDNIVVLYNLDERYQLQIYDLDLEKVNEINLEKGYYSLIGANNDTNTILLSKRLKDKIEIIEIDFLNSIINTKYSFNKIDRLFSANYYRDDNYLYIFSRLNIEGWLSSKVAFGLIKFNLITEEKIFWHNENFFSLNNKSIDSIKIFNNDIVHFNASHKYIIFKIS